MIVIVLLTLLGAFYVFAGVVAVRVGLSSRLLDQAIAAISLEKTAPSEVVRTRLNLAVALLTFASGILLMARLDAALWAFVACAGLQAACLFVVAPRWLDQHDPPSPTSRRQSINAFVIYLMATALVGWAWAMGHLVPIAGAQWQLLAAVVGVLAVFAAYVGRGFWPARR